MGKILHHITLVDDQHQLENNPFMDSIIATVYIYICIRTVWYFQSCFFFCQKSQHICFFIYFFLWLENINLDDHCMLKTFFFHFKVLFLVKSLSEELILGSTNPQYDKRLFNDLPVLYMKTTSSEHVLCTFIVFCFCFDIQNNLCTQNVLRL